MKLIKAWRKAAFRTVFLPGLFVLAVTGCSSLCEVPITVSSDPPGSYVLFQTLLPASDMYDWIYLGTTPLVFVRPMDFKELKKTETVTLKAMKEGYFDQTKSWSWENFVDEFKDKGGISWDPHLVPMTGEEN